MSPKELMYIEDALGHETFLQSQCPSGRAGAYEPGAENYVTQLANRHQQLFQKLYGLM